ncbi:MAG: M48 family metallopeptidase [Bacteroidales bacterium]
MKEEFIPELGKVHITKRKHCKRITIRYDPKGKIKVSIPGNVTYNAGLKYIQSKKSVIKKKIKVLQDEQNNVDFNNFRTKWHRVVLKPEKRTDAFYQIDHSHLIIRFPCQIAGKDPWLQSIIRKGIEETLRQEAKTYLPQRVFKLASQNNFTFNNLYIKNVKTLWGSCSSKNNINLNIHLMRLPDHLIDYVLLHELCHTIHKNHGPAFWNHLDNITRGNLMMLRKELQNYHPRF